MNDVFFDGCSLAERPVGVSLEQGMLVVRDLDGAVVRCWIASELSIDALQEGATFHVSPTRAPDEMLVLHDAALAARLAAHARAVQASPGGRHQLSYGAACLAALLGLAALLYVMSPRIAHAVAVHVPLETERALGARLEALLDLGACESPEAEAVLERMTRALDDERGAGYQVRIIDADLPNAFALPGGVVLVTRALVRDADDGDELLGVLAHEVEHIAQRHVLAGALRGALLTALWSITLGDYSGLLVLDPSTAYRIANLEFTRADEQAADDGAVRRLHARGFSHRGLIAFFEHAEEEYGGGEGPSWLSTHPSTEARLARLRAVRDLETPRAPVSDAELETLRRACR